MEQLPPTEDFSVRYWRCFWEFAQRPFKPAERRALEKLLSLTYGRGKSEVFIARLDDLAESINTTRHNLNPILQNLVTRDVLGRDERAGTWWFCEIDLWRVIRRNAADPASAARAAAAEKRILDDNPLLANQPELFPGEISNADVQAEANRMSAADGLPAGLPAADPEAARVKIKHAVLKFNTGGDGSGVKTKHAVLKFNTSRSLDARGRGASEPGNQVQTIPGKPGVVRPPGKPGRKEDRLDADGLALLAELIEFCGGDGRAGCSDEQRDAWAGRVLFNPRLLERCLREVQAHIREERSAVPNRYGYVKWLWSGWEKEAAAPASGTSTIATPRGAHPAEPLPPDDETGARIAADLREYRTSKRGQPTIGQG